MRQRILRWYQALKLLERDLNKKTTVSADFIARKEKELERIEENVWRISVPAHLSPDLYTLRDHVEFVRRRIAHLRDEPKVSRSTEPAMAGKARDRAQAIRQGNPPNEQAPERLLSSPPPRPQECRPCR